MLTCEQKIELKSLYSPEGSDLRNLQYTFLDILSAFDKFCRNNNIKYSLHAGTLLGAIRHEGFIPWDDDADVIVTRDEYNKILALKSNDDKLEDNLFLWRVGPVGWLSCGKMFIDLMVVDNVPDNYFLRKYKQIMCRCLFCLLKANNFVHRRWNTSFKFWMLLIPIAMLFSNKYLLKRYHSIAQIGNGNQTSKIGIYTDTLSDIGKDFDNDIFDEYIDVSFEGRKLMCIKKYDEFLRRYYGDYMTLPKSIQTHGRI